MPPIFKLNGSECYLASHLANESARLGYDSSDWQGLANQFVQLRGARPSYGYLLCRQSSIDNASQKKLEVTLEDGSIKSFTVSIEWTKKIGGTSYEADRGFNLVKVVDERYALASDLVGEHFNSVLRYDAPLTPGSKGAFTYHPDTLNKISSSLTIPYDWEAVFNKVWKLPSNAPLDTKGHTFPSYTPQDIDFRYTTRAEAMEMLAQWTGFEVVPEEGRNGLVYGLAKVQNRPDFTSYDHLLARNPHPKFKEAGEPIPKTVKCYFAKDDESSNDVEAYHTVDRASAVTNNNGTTIHCRLPARFVGDGSDAPQKTKDVIDDFMANRFLRWNQFPSQEKTFYKYLPIHPNEKIEQVRYYEFGGTGYTEVRSVLKQPLLIAPTDLDGEAISIAFGKVAIPVVPLNPFIRVNITRIIAGRVVPFATQVITLNEHHQAYQAGDTITIFQRDGDEFWSTTKAGGGGEGTELARFELKEDKSTTDLTRLAYLLDDDGNRIVDDQNVPIEIYVVDPWQRFQGYKERTDPFYDFQSGFKGTGSFILQSDPGSIYQGKGLYRIVEMEHVARYIETRTPNEQDYGNNPPHYSGSGKAIATLNYWDGRAPKTEEEEVSTGHTHYTIDWQDRNQCFPAVKPGSPLKLIWDEVAEVFILFSARQAPVGTVFALLIKGVPRVIRRYSSLTGLAELTPGYKEDAAIPLTRDAQGTEFTGSLKYPAVNPVWENDIIAGTGDVPIGQTEPEPIPVIATGYIDTWIVYVQGQGEVPKEAFIIQAINYPVAIIEGRTSTAVATGQAFDATVFKVLWGRPLNVTEMKGIKNLIGDADDNAYCLVMICNDGSYQALDLACPAGGEII
jgi:hypothetical protein